MPAYRVRALVLRKTKLGETDVIVTLLGEDGRQIRGVAKGMRKPGSRFGGRLEPYASVRLMLHEGRSLDVVSEAETLDSHAALREDYERSVAASVVADVLDKISLEGQAEERLFDLSDVTFGVLESADPEHTRLLVLAFLAKAMAMHGYRPELSSCACCASDAEGGQLFSPASGGVLCPECGTDDGSVVAFDEPGRALLEAVLGSKMAEIAEWDVPTATIEQCIRLMRSFVNYHVPARLKALDLFVGGTA